jgi:hypothetical protein
VKTEENGTALESCAMIEPQKESGKSGRLTVVEK